MQLKNSIEYIKRMGLKYISFRVWYEIQRRSGLLRYFYPVRVPVKRFITLKQWRNEAKPFFVKTNTKFNYTESVKKELENKSVKILAGEIQFFTGKWYFLGREYDWLTNPDNGYRFDKNVHWTKVEDFNITQGDIKYVWEKARFSYIYTLMRNDHANGTDNSRFVWDEILSWISHSPYNCGPHYKCSQEISVRVLNWIFVLYFYKNSDQLTENEFKIILNSIRAQAKHVESNILFSKIAVRNNHAITESLCLFTVGLLFPWFPESSHWINRGQQYLEEEGLYQIYEDGSYIQHSFNYHRVVVQLYTWALAVARVNSIQFSILLRERLKKSIHFLQHFIDTENGQVPNWGANDSALLFPLNSQDPKDFRPQLNAISILLTEDVPYSSQAGLMEDSYWFDCGNFQHSASESKTIPAVFYRSFNVGGYHVIRTNDICTYVRCAKHHHRPFHADNLHVDIWWNHKNIIRDAGTYKYNTDPEYVRFFTGSAGHNTLMIDGFDQMQKGKRFVWYNWSQAVKASLTDAEQYVRFEGAISAFKQIGSKVVHTRYVNVYREMPIWFIYDTIQGCDDHTYSQSWNVHQTFFDSGFKIVSRSDSDVIDPVIKNVWFSDCYGEIQDARQIVFSSHMPIIKTTIYHEAFEKMVDLISYENTSNTSIFS